MEKSNIVDVPIHELEMQMDVSTQNAYGNVIDVPIEQLQVMHNAEVNDVIPKINKILEGFNARKMKCQAEFISYDNGKCLLLLFCAFLDGFVHVHPMFVHK